jgi:hypothetical protein
MWHVSVMLHLLCNIFSILHNCVIHKNFWSCRFLDVITCVSLIFFGGHLYIITHSNHYFIHLFLKWMQWRFHALSSLLFFLNVKYQSAHNVWKQEVWQRGQETTEEWKVATFLRNISFIVIWQTAITHAHFGQRCNNPVHINLFIWK